VKSGEMGRWGDGEMGRWGDGEMGRWGESNSSFPHHPISLSPHPLPHTLKFL